MTTLIEQLRNLPPKQALLKLLEEKAKRAAIRKTQNPLPQQDASDVLATKTDSLLFDAQHCLYDLLHKKARYKVYFGGRGGVKSWGFAEALVRIAARRQVRILCVREFQSSIADSVHALLKDTIFRLGLQSFFHITDKTIKSSIGSVFIFKGMHGNEQGIRSTHGIDFCWVEEGQAVSKSSWEALTPTIRNLGAEIWVSYNMVSEDDPTHKRFVEVEDWEAEQIVIKPRRSDSIVHYITYRDNPYFEQTSMYQEMLDDRAQSESLYEHIWLGKPMKMSDAMIFAAKCVVEEFDDDLWRSASRLYFGLDFGYSQDPAAAVRMFILEEPYEITLPNGRIHAGVHKDLYISHEAYRRKVENNDYGPFLTALPDIMGWPIKADSARPETISHIRSIFQLQCSAAEKWAGSVEDGISHVLSFRRIHVHKRCVNVQRESRAYQWKTDPRDKTVILPIPIDKHNHAWDAVRYGLDGEITRRGALGTWQKLGAMAQAEASQLPH